MKRMKKMIIIGALLFGPLSLPAAAQDAANLPGPGTGGGSPPSPPIFAVLDADHNSVISTEEIAQAPAALQKLDKNGDGRLTPDEYIPPRPDGPFGPPGGNRAGAPPKQDLSSGPADDDRRPPKPPIDLALDADRDDVISAGEIAQAPVALQKLDLDGDGQLSAGECLSAGRPRMPSGDH
ncbi:MAG: hypothetical protein AB1724_08550 [Thermodesulfobacteriota bacterium]